MHRCALVVAVVAARVKACGWRLLSDLMSESGTVRAPLAGWDPRRRAALERLWERFGEASGGVRLSDEVIADRRREVTATDHATLRDEVILKRSFRPSPGNGGGRGG